MTSSLRRLGGALLLAYALLLTLAPQASGQQPEGRVLVRVHHDGAPVPGAQVSAGSTRAITDGAGQSTLTLNAGPAEIRVERIGYLTALARVLILADSTVELVVPLEEEAIEIEEIVVASTRADRRIEDEPLRVEVIGREEVEEKLLMTPGDIAMLLNETAGLRIQPTAPSLGGAAVRIQGLQGRHTQILSDGLPLYGGQTGALGPLQIPPMDLGQVEVIKGAASALYGASAVGGVVNLISRRPASEVEHELLLNQSTLGGTDVVGWTSGPLGDDWGYSLLAGGHRQTLNDRDDDGWADLPAFRRALVRPRLFWSDGEGKSALLTVGGMSERREGGSMPGRPTPGGFELKEGLETDRLDAGGVLRMLLGKGTLLSTRASATAQRHEHDYGEAPERDRHFTGFAEAALSGSRGAHYWVVGTALQVDRLWFGDGVDLNHAFTTPGLFAQDEYALSHLITLSASARVDRHSEYGTFLSPRISTLLRPGEGWTVRGSFGTGYSAPTPWTEETEPLGVRSLRPLAGLEAERARSASLDVGKVTGPIELNATLFGSRVEGAVRLRRDGESFFELYNAPGDVRTGGTELLARYHKEGVHVTATHVYLRASEPVDDGNGRREVPLTPQHAAGIVAAREWEGSGRIGVELYYTGTQALEDNPYRDVSKPYFIFGFLAERRFGRVRLFLNAENLFDARQTREDPLLRPVQSDLGSWITAVWAPLEGRAFNAGVRWAL